jgi:hypothetical protein
MFPFRQSPSVSVSSPRCPEITPSLDKRIRLFVWQRRHRPITPDIHKYSPLSRVKPLCLQWNTFLTNKMPLSLIQWIRSTIPHAFRCIPRSRENLLSNEFSFHSIPLHGSLGYVVWNGHQNSAERFWRVFSTDAHVSQTIATVTNIPIYQPILYISWK